MEPYLYSIRVALDTPDVPAYSQILLKQISYFNTIIVIADVHWGFTHSATRLAAGTGRINTPALVRCRPLYILLRIKQRPVFLINSRLRNGSCARHNPPQLLS